MYDKIVNPKTNRKVKINSKIGKSILMNYYYRINKKLPPNLVKKRGGANPAIHEWNPNVWRGFSTVLPHIIENTNISVEQKIYLFLQNKAASTNRPLESLFPFTISSEFLNNLVPPFQVTLSHLQVLEPHQQQPNGLSNFRIQGLGDGNGPHTTGNYLDKLKHAAAAQGAHYRQSYFVQKSNPGLIIDLEEGNLENLIDVLTP